MKETIKYLFIVVLIIMVSATTVNVMTVKPAIPNQVLVEHFGNSDQAKEFIRNGYKKGYQLKYIQTVHNEAKTWLVVMEKF